MIWKCLKEVDVIITNRYFKELNDVKDKVIQEIYLIEIRNDIMKKFKVMTCCRNKRRNYI